MGGSSLAPEVICATAGVELTVLDSSDPDQVRAALGDRLDRTVVVVSSKSGSTVETDSQRRAFEAAFEAAGIDPAGPDRGRDRPRQPARQGRPRPPGYRVVNADPDVGGRYSALTAFGLVPSGLAGADVGRLLDEAELVSDLLAADDDANPGSAARRGDGRHRPAARQAGPRRRRLRAARLRRLGRAADRREHRQGGHRCAARRGRRHRQPRGRRARRRRDRRTPRRRTSDDDDGPADDPTGRPSGWPGRSAPSCCCGRSPPRSAGRLLGINPFDQPDVESAKKAARALLDAPGRAPPSPTSPTARSTVQALGGDWLGDADTLLGRGAPAARPGRPRARLRRGDGLPRPRSSTPTSRRSATSLAPAAASGRSPSAGARGSCTRPGSSTRAARPSASSSR